MLIACVSVHSLALAQSAEALREKHQSLKASLAASPFRQPLLLESGASANKPSGRVYAVVEHGFATAGTSLQSSRHWCEILILPSNVKACSVSTEGSQERVHLAVGKKVRQAAEDAYTIDFDYRVRSATPNYLSVEMSADSGPLGTSGYRLALEAVSLDRRRTFIHMTYSYSASFAARLATDAYLATVGRDKVGFSSSGLDESGAPVYVGGIRGVAERNTMRYFLAVDAFLSGLALPSQQRAEKRMNEWFALTERYPRQLRELTLDDYLAAKRIEMQSLRANDSGAGPP